MRYFARMSPIRAVRDLRLFLAGRQRYELWFMIAALVLTGVIMVAFLTEPEPAREYHPDIVYVQQWRADRTDAEIIAQQKIDQAKKDKDDAELEQRKAKLRAEFKRLDDGLKKYGI